MRWKRNAWPLPSVRKKCWTCAQPSADLEKGQRRWPRGRPQAAFCDGSGLKCAERIAEVQDRLISLTHTIVLKSGLSGQRNGIRRGGGGRLWPQDAGTRLRYRSSLPALAEGRRRCPQGRGIPALYSLGSWLQGGARHPHGGGMHQAVPHRHDDPHRHSRNPLHLRGKAAGGRSFEAVRGGGGGKDRPGIHCREACRA